MSVIVGVDPGGRNTGVVTRRRDDVLRADVLVRPAADRIEDHDRIGGYVHAVLELVASHVADAGPGALVSVESVKAPNPHVRRRDGNSVTDPNGVIATAAVYGAILAVWPDAVIVAPGGNGANPEWAYPPEIRSRARLGGPTSHARSAYDVAGSAATIARFLHPKGPDTVDHRTLPPCTGGGAETDEPDDVVAYWASLDGRVERAAVGDTFEELTVCEHCDHPVEDCTCTPNGS